MFTYEERQAMVKALEERRQALRSSFNDNYFGTSAAEKRNIEIECRNLGAAIEKIQAMG